MASEESSQFSLAEEYKKPTGITPDDIADLRRWLETQPHLPSKYITDLDLILAFHSCDCSTGLTKEVVDLNYTLRTLITSFLKERSFDDRVKKSLDTMVVMPLPAYTKEGYAVMYLRFLDCEPKNFHQGEVMRCILMILDLWQYLEGTWPGFILLIDFEGTVLGHVTRMEIQNTQQFLYYLQESLVVKLKGFYIINAPSFIDKVMLFMKPFMKKELLDIIKIHTNGAEAITSLVPLEALPKECGGSYKSLQECKDDVIAMLESGKSYFKNENLKRVTESLRPGKPKTISDIFGGVEGSFKKLGLD